MSNGLKRLALTCGLLILIGGCNQPTTSEGNEILPDVKEQIELIPLPAQITYKSGQLNLSRGLFISDLTESELVRTAVNRFKQYLNHIDIPTNNGDASIVRISVDSKTEPILSLDTDESYELSIQPNAINLSADNYTGLNHGLSTLTQLLFHARESQFLKCQDITDEPRFAHRGLMIDVCRHWIPKEVIIKNLEYMSLAKMNVLHLHLSDDQAFRVESKMFPKLHLEGSNNQYYKQSDLHEIVTKASELGIRVIPEFDMPGHSSSWLAAYPQLGMEKGSYELKETYGVFSNVLNPISPITYEFINRLVGEMASIFPDEYFHIGGNEVLPEQWVDHQDIKDFMIKNELQNILQVQSYFILRVQQILKTNGKKMLAWDEALRQQTSADDPIIQAWQSQGKAIEAAQRGIKAINSKGWFLDHKLSAGDLYNIDPQSDPRALNFNPDTTNYQIWSLTINIQNKIQKGRLYLFPKSANYSGLIQIMDRSALLENIKLKGGNLTFSFDLGGGNLQSDISIEDNTLTGILGAGLIEMKTTGKLIGSDRTGGEPLPEFKKNKPLNKDELEMIVGGEGCIWSEWVTKNNLESRIWPSAMAISEKLWSPQAYTDDSNYMYRRLELYSNLLISCKLDYSEYRTSFIQNNVGNNSLIDLSIFIDLLEEVKYNERWSFSANHNINESLDNIADVVLPESLESYRFGVEVKRLLEEGNSNDANLEILNFVDRWIPVYRNLETLFSNNDKFKNIEVLALALSDLSKIAKHVMENGILTEEESNYYNTLKLNAQRKIDGVFLAPAEDLIRLIDSYLAQL